MIRARRAHPRSRGENEAKAKEGKNIKGSSPLTRGKPHRRIQGVVACRLIPAHAGKTRRQTRTLAPCGAHPRSRGENSASAFSTWSSRGSSPLTRGKLQATPQADNVPGLIPAHAGKTVFLRSQEGNRRAHPRSRGENHGVQSRIVNQTGSSPLTRGKPPEHGADRSQKGLIPAHAGKTARAPAISSAQAAHPRSRGENVRTHARASWLLGSSPLTRGKLSLTDALRNTGLAHPRSRGENVSRERPSGRSRGSSPLTRGKPPPGLPKSLADGLIPAHAGKTPPVSSSAGAAGAHPRSRGENQAAPGDQGPPAWLIPAHAGKTVFSTPR